MSRTTFQGALAELYATLTTNGHPITTLSTAGVAKVYPAEPGAGGWVKPCSVTLEPAGITPTEWEVAVRVYVDDQYADRAQDLLIDATVAVGDALRDAAAFGPDQWQMGWQADLGCRVAMTEVQVGREDGF